MGRGKSELRRGWDLGVEGRAKQDTFQGGGSDGEIKCGGGRGVFQNKKKKKEKCQC